MADTFNLTNATLKKTSQKRTDDIKSLAKKLAPSSVYNTGAYTGAQAKSVTPDDFAPLNAKFMKRENKTEADLRAEAEEYADNAFKNRQEALEIKTEKSLNTLKKKLGDAERNEAEFYKSAEKSYNAEREQINDRAIRNGMVHSSVYTGLNAAAESAYADKLNTAAAEYSRLAQSIRTEIELVNEQKELSLQDYELKKAAEFDKKLAELRLEETAARKEVTEYNKELAYFLAHYDEAIRQSIENWKRYNEANGNG